MAHIGIDARLVHYRVGGISRYITALARAFEELRPDQRITLLQSRKSRRPLSRRFDCAKLWTPPHHPLERAALSIELWRHGLDLLHSPDFIAPVRGAKRHIITVHDLSFVHFPEYLTEASRRYYNGQIRASVQRADHILAVSEATKADIMDILDAPADKISVQWHGVDERFKAMPRESGDAVLRELDLPEAYFLFVGTLEPRKNLAGLARAYRELKAQQPDAPKLVLAGRPGWHYAELMADLQDARLGDDLILRHAVSDAQLPALYNRAIALVLPSFYEGFGLPALEAMACGCPTIVSQTPALSEIVADVGIQVDPHETSAIANAMLKALTDGEWRRRQCQAGLERAAGFRWADTAMAVLAAYDAALN